MIDDHPQILQMLNRYGGVEAKLDFESNYKIDCFASDVSQWREYNIFWKINKKI